MKARNTARYATSSEQHEKAALEYSAAAQGIEDTEALRILSLLEHHHEQLARIVKAHSTQATSSDSPVTPRPVESLSAASDTATSADVAASQGPPQISSRRSSSPVLQRRIARELSSTIASDLATARGIPNNQQRNARQSSPVPTAKAPDARRSSRKHRASGSATSKTGPIDPSNPPMKAVAQPEQHPTAVATNAQIKQSHSSAADQNAPNKKDDAFHKFYATFEVLLSKLSAPLAFAGLPLGPDEQSQNARDKVVVLNQPKQSDSTSEGPNVMKLFSKAALRAVKEDNPGFGGMQESYMIVPTSGGSVSYAGILSRQERHARQHSMEQPLDPDEEAAEYFVDAKTSPQSSSPKESRKISITPARLTKKTQEELELENESLKQLTDNLSRRLYMWEKSAQSQSMALQQSIRTLQPPSQTLPEGGTDHRVNARLGELENELASAKKEMEGYERENEKLKTIVARYRERWEKLKEGARVRREGTDTSAAEAAQNDL